MQGAGGSQALEQSTEQRGGGSLPGAVGEAAGRWGWARGSQPWGGGQTGRARLREGQLLALPGLALPKAEAKQPSTKASTDQPAVEGSAGASGEGEQMGQGVVGVKAQAGAQQPARGSAAKPGRRCWQEQVTVAGARSRRRARRSHHQARREPGRRRGRMR